MNKHEAQALARKRPTIGALKEAIRQRQRLMRVGEPSRVNSSLTVSQACDIFERAIAKRTDDEVIEDSSRDQMMATNILWECL